MAPIGGRSGAGLRRRRHELVGAVAAVLIVSGLVHLGMFVLDDRPWGGPLSWRKPFTFGVSLGVTLLGVVWVTGYLDMSARVRTALIAVVAVDCVLEVGGITVQAWRDQPSHLNTTSPFSAAVALAVLLAVGLRRLGVPETTRHRAVVAATFLYVLGAVAVLVLDLARL